MILGYLTSPQLRRVAPLRVTAQAAALAGLALLFRWTARMRERAQLTRLDDRMLKDIGISRVDVAREAGKPFWRA